MKKLYYLMFALLLSAGCNKEKIYKDDLNGQWAVYKYLLYNVDKTTMFTGQHPTYSITFTSGGQFTEIYGPLPPDTAALNHTGTYTFKDNDQMIELYYTEIRVIDSTHSVIDTSIRDFTIFNLTKTHVQLRDDSSQLYMNKKTQ